MKITKSCRKIIAVEMNININLSRRTVKVNLDKRLYWASLQGTVERKARGDESQAHSEIYEARAQPSLFLTKLTLQIRSNQPRKHAVDFFGLRICYAPKILRKIA